MLTLQAPPEPVPAIDLPAERARKTLARPLPEPAFDVVEEWGMQSFPASDPPSNW